MITFLVWIIGTVVIGLPLGVFYARWTMRDYGYDLWDWDPFDYMMAGLLVLMGMLFWPFALVGAVVSPIFWLMGKGVQKLVAR